MSLAPRDFDALAAFFDPVAVASSLRDIADGRPAAPGGDESVKIPAVTGTAAAHDQEVLRRLLPPEVYAYWRQAGYLGAYCMTFMLRHAVTFLALAAHDHACPCFGLEQVLEKRYSFSCRAAAADCIAILSENRAPAHSLPLLGFSALGIHFIFRRAGACRAFDLYAIGCCGETAEGLFCNGHTREAWWSYEGPGASTQADMFRFYGRRENLYAYEERKLEELVGRFWARMKKSSSDLPVTDRSVSEALAFFGYPTVADLCARGQLKLRRRYTERARQLHPDLGGGHEPFLRLKRHYEILRNRLSRENAGVAA